MQMPRLCYNLPPSLPYARRCLADTSVCKPFQADNTTFFCGDRCAFTCEPKQ